MTNSEWRKLLYLHAVKIAQARTKEELRDATRAGDAVAKLAAAAGIKLDETGGETSATPSIGGEEKPYEMSPRKLAAWIARNGPPELREDQVELPTDSDE